MWNVFIENYRQNLFFETTEILQHLEFAHAKVIRQLYDYIYHSAEETREMVYEVGTEFKQGMIDPSREVALQEKQAAIKKMVIKQKIMPYNRPKPTMINLSKMN